MAIFKQNKLVHWKRNSLVLPDPVLLEGEPLFPLLGFAFTVEIWSGFIKSTELENTANQVRIDVSLDFSLWY